MYNRSLYESPGAYRSSYLPSSPLRNKSSHSFYSSPKRSPGLDSEGGDLLSFRLAQERLREQEVEHEHTVGELRRQARTLREQLNSENEVHFREQQRMREEHERRMFQLRSEKEEELQRLHLQVEEVHSNAQQKRTESDEIEKQCRLFTQENSSLRIQLGNLKSEIEHVKVQILDRTKNQVSQLEREKKIINDQHSAKVQAMNTEHTRNMNMLNETIENRENTLKRLEEELNSLRKELNDKNLHADQQIGELETLLRDTRMDLQSRMGEHEHLKRTRDENKRENKAIANENHKMTRETAKTLQENLEMEEEIKRLNKLVYGRNFNN